MGGGDWAKDLGFTAERFPIEGAEKTPKSPRDPHARLSRGEWPEW